MTPNISASLDQLNHEIQSDTSQWNSMPISSIEDATNAFSRIATIVTEWENKLKLLEQSATARLETPLRDAEFEIAFSEYSSCTKLLSPIGEAFRSFTARLLSSFPHAPINYGEPCVFTPRLWTTTESTKQPDFCKNYPSLQEIRGDGNCFYTSFTVLYLQHLSKNDDALASFVKRVTDDAPISYKKILLNLLLDIKQSPSIITPRLQENTNVLSFIHYFRHLIQTHPAFQERVKIAMDAQIFDDPTYGKSKEDFIQHHILSMGVEADQLQIQLLCEVLDFSITVHYADAHGECIIKTKTPRFSADRFYRNGAHYCILYPSKQKQEEATQKQREEAIKSNPLVLTGGQPTVAPSSSNANSSELPQEVPVEINLERAVGGDKLMPSQEVIPQTAPSLAPQISKKLSKEYCIAELSPSFLTRVFAVLVVSIGYMISLLGESHAASSNTTGV